LGIYDRAWRTSNLITQNLAWTIADVAMPSLSALKERPEAMRQAYHRMLRFLGIVAFPLLIGMFVVADEFVLLLYGPKWVETVLPLRILIVFTLQRAISSPVGVLFNAVGRPDIGLKLTLAMLPLYFTGIFAGAHFGINGVAVAVTGIRTLGGFAAVYLACRLVQLSVLKVLKSLGPPLAIALLMAAAVYGVKLFLSSLFNLPVAISLLIYISVGGFVYFILLSTLFIPQMDEILFAIDNFSVKVGSRLRLLLRLKKQSREPIA
jgi:PST family polysaccharide transporter